MSRWIVWLGFFAVFAALLSETPSVAAGQIRRGAGMTDDTPTGRDPLPDFGLGVDGEFTRAGIRFLRVQAQGPAARSGLEAEDVLLAVNGKTLRRPSDWIDVMSNNNGLFRLAVRDCRTGETVYRDVDLRQ